MTLAEELHGSRFHGEGFNPNCPKCLRDEGISGIIKYLTECAKSNEREAKRCAGFAETVCSAAMAKVEEQHRMIRVLSLYRRIVEIKG